jgi:hypothetical protein
MYYVYAGDVCRKTAIGYESARAVRVSEAYKRLTFYVSTAFDRSSSDTIDGRRNVIFFWLVSNVDAGVEPANFVRISVFILVTRRAICVMRVSRL